MYALVGSRTTRERQARGQGISVYAVCPQSGGLELLTLHTGLINPSYLLPAADGRRIYTVHGDCQEISAFEFDPSTASLRFLNQQSTQGLNPVHLCFTPDQKAIVVVNHLGASTAVLPIDADGALQPVAQVQKFSGAVGPHRIEQTQAKPHAAVWDPSGQCMVVPDKGLDAVFSFAWESGVLRPTAQQKLSSREGAGPRHACFHPSLPVLYCVNELDSSVTVYDWHAQEKRLHPVQVISTLSQDFTANSRAAAIVLSACGRHLYVSNRGQDSISLYAVDPATGALSWQGHVATQGRTPRFLGMHPTGNYLYALNEDSDSIVQFVVDGNTGGLEAIASWPSASPVCMVFTR